MYTDTRRGDKMGMNEPLRNAVNHCGMCSVPKKFEKGLMDIADARKECAHCKLGSTGIYKFDAIYTAVGPNKTETFNPNKGRKSTREKQYGKAIRDLREKGQSIRKIAKILKISPGTVQKIINGTEE